MTAWEEQDVLTDAECERLLQPTQRVDSALGVALRAVASVPDGPVAGEGAALAAFRAHQAGLLPAGSDGLARAGSATAARGWWARLTSRAAAATLGGVVVLAGGAAAAAETGAVPNFVHPLLVHLHLAAPNHHGQGNAPGSVPPGEGKSGPGGSGSSPGGAARSGPSGGPQGGQGTAAGTAAHGHRTGRATGSSGQDQPSTGTGNGSSGQGNGQSPSAGHNNGKHLGQGKDSTGTRHAYGHTRTPGSTGAAASAGTPGKKVRRHGATSQRHTPSPQPTATGVPTLGSGTGNSTKGKSGKGRGPGLGTTPSPVPTSVVSPGHRGHS